MPVSSPTRLDQNSASIITAKCNEKWEQKAPYVKILSSF